MTGLLAFQSRTLPLFSFRSYVREQYLPILNLPSGASDQHMCSENKVVAGATVLLFFAFQLGLLW